MKAQLTHRLGSSTRKPHLPTCSLSRLVLFKELFISSFLPKSALK